MKILTCIQESENTLENYCPAADTANWDLVTSGEWSQSQTHSGWIAYFITKVSAGTWVLRGIERNAELDGLTEDDVAEGLRNDDQVQAMWGMSLEEAQSQSYERIVAVMLGAPEGLSIVDAATRLYDAVEQGGGKVVDMPDGDGLLE